MWMLVVSIVGVEHGGVLVVEQSDTFHVRLAYHKSYVVRILERACVEFQIGSRLFDTPQVVEIVRA